MTCREKLTLEHPENIDADYNGGCLGCPRMYGYLPNPDFCCYDTLTRTEACTKCWNREIPETVKTEEETTMKTVEEMIKEIKTLEKEIKSIEERNKFDDTATQLKNAYDSLVRAGFTEEQSWEIFMTVINKGDR